MLFIEIKERAIGNIEWREIALQCIKIDTCHQRVFLIFILVENTVFNQSLVTVAAHVNGGPFMTDIRVDIRKVVFPEKVACQSDRSVGNNGATQFPGIVLEEGIITDEEIIACRRGEE
jgi:hypothetical protein